VSLVIDNDGAPPGREAARGHGLANIAARAARMGGSMSTEADGDRFILATHVPSEPEATA
jgi:two-component system sensor histidine kinase DesK